MRLTSPLLARSLFRDRVDAGRRLAEKLDHYRGKHPVVLGIPRGGVPVAAEIARRLDGVLDVVVARKLGAPQHAELAIGAVTANGGRFLNDDVIRALKVSEEYLATVTAEQMAEARRREERFRRGRAPLDLKGKPVILVDDGLATGATMRAAARAARARGPERLVAAVPVGSADAVTALKQEVDEMVCLAEPEPLIAIGLHYGDFAQVDDARVLELLKR